MVRELSTELGLTVSGASAAALEIADPAGAKAQMSAPFQYQAAVLWVSDNASESRELLRFMEAVTIRAPGIGFHPLSCEDGPPSRSPYLKDDRRG